MNQKAKTSAILLAGGIGSRMQSAMPKQFLEIHQKPIACYSFDLFLQMPEIDEIVVVCSPDFRHFFNSDAKPVIFALPGERRQDSVYNGLLASSHNLICIHDAARPFIDRNLVSRILKAALDHGVATAAMPVKFTVKEGDANHFVKNTPDRTYMWEIQTPQVLGREILIQGFDYANKNKLTVTDDVSLAELVGKQVKLVEGSHTNLKITVPSDLVIAYQLISKS
jgi:2-C-methyl-D-erythritol 4-phosphate cytidylyltransferase